MVANTVKHADGDSADKLKAARPEFFEPHHANSQVTPMPFRYTPRVFNRLVAPDPEPVGLEVALTSRHVVFTAKGQKRGSRHRASCITRAEKSEELHAFLQAPLHHLPTDQHLADDFPDLRRSEVEALIEYLNAVIDLFARQVRIADC